jgi:hypothetical protein
MKIFFLFLTLLFGGLFAQTPSLSVRTGPESSFHQIIDIEDKLKLENFFRHLITTTEIGYTVCHYKPVSIVTYDVDPLLKLNFLSFSKNIKSNVLFDNCFHKFESNFSKLKNKNFIFKQIKWNGFHCLEIIDIHLLKDTIKSNLITIQKITNSSQTSEEIYQKFIDIEEINVSKENNALLGIFLGYGTNNSIAFENRRRLENLIKCKLGCVPPFAAVAWYKLTEDERESILNTGPIDFHFAYKAFKQNIDDLINKWRCLRKKLKAFSNDALDSKLDFSFVIYPGFMIYEDPKNNKNIEKLRKNYNQARKDICKTYNTNSFLETTVKLLSK